MPETGPVQQKFRELNCCVIIPTYNNERTLARIITETLEYTSGVIVVNDGSTDNTSSILHGFPQIKVISLPVNKGKGNAIREGFRAAIAAGFRYAITIDSDGQHFTEDYIRFLEKAEDHPDSMIVGARNMEQESVPGTSSFGHKFSIFWYRIETGYRIPDVQTGFRLYPLEHLRDMRLYSNKYELEVEVLVRLAWKMVPVKSVPVKVYYAPREERVSHFRKFRDFTRVSIMNSMLVLMAILWVRPINFILSLRKKSLRRIFNDHVINSADSNSKLSWSAGMGIFFGIAPFWGWQMILAYTTARFLKLNRFIAVGASNISFPPFLPLIIFFSYQVGGIFLGVESSEQYHAGINLYWVKNNLMQYVLGSFILATAMALAFSALSFILLEIFRKRPVDNN